MISDRRPNRAFLRSRESALFESRFFRSSNPIRTCLSRKSTFSTRCVDRICSIEKVFEARRISHHTRKHTITPYNSFDAGLTATMLLLLLLTTTRRRTSCSPPTSSAYRHPKAAARAIDDPFATPLLQQSCCCAVLSLASLDRVQRHNRDDEADEGPPCAKRTLCSRKRRDEDVLEHSKQLIADSLRPTSRRTRNSFELTFACPKLPRIKRPKKEHKNKYKNYTLDPTDDKKGIQTHPVE